MAKITEQLIINKDAFGRITGALIEKHQDETMKLTAPKRFVKVGNEYFNIDRILCVKIHLTPSGETATADVYLGESTGNGIKLNPNEFAILKPYLEGDA